VLPAEFGSAYLEPHQVVAMISDSHLVRFRVADSQCVICVSNLVFHAKLIGNPITSSRSAKILCVILVGLHDSTVSFLEKEGHNS